MTQWLCLAGAVLCEVCGTLFLRLASAGRRMYYLVVILGYALAFALLTSALGQGLGLGVAYGIWAAAGVALTAVASRIIFKEPLTPIMAGGILAIMAGVLLVELDAAH